MRKEQFTLNYNLKKKKQPELITIQAVILAQKEGFELLYRLLSCSLTTVNKCSILLTATLNHELLNPANR